MRSWRPKYEEIGVISVKVRAQKERIPFFPAIYILLVLPAIHETTNGCASYYFEKFRDTKPILIMYFFIYF